MKRKFISAEESFTRWKKDPKYVAAYNALEREFALASALIKARSEAEMTQEQVAEAMGTTQKPWSRALKVENSSRQRARWSGLPKPHAPACASVLSRTEKLPADPPRLRPIRPFTLPAHLIAKGVDAFGEALFFAVDESDVWA
jgi:hypothetical protein